MNKKIKGKCGDTATSQHEKESVQVQLGVVDAIRILFISKFCYERNPLENFPPTQ